MNKEVTDTAKDVIELLLCLSLQNLFASDHDRKNDKYKMTMANTFDCES